MERVAINILGPPSPTESVNRHLPGVMDYFTKWPETTTVCYLISGPISLFNKRRQKWQFIREVVGPHGVERNVELAYTYSSTKNYINFITPIRETGSADTKRCPVYTGLQHLVARHLARGHLVL